MKQTHIRPATPADSEAIARVRVLTWQDAYRNILPAEFLAGMEYRAIAERWRKNFFEERIPGVEAFVAETEGDGIVGVAICGPERGGDPDYHAEIHVLYVLPGFQDRGIGRELVGACIQHIARKLKTDTLLIWVLKENPYRRFYESLGGKVVREKQVEIGGISLLEVGYGWESIRPLLDADRFVDSSE